MQLQYRYFNLGDTPTPRVIISNSPKVFVKYRYDMKLCESFIFGNKSLYLVKYLTTTYLL